MTFEITEKQPHSKGTVYSITVNNKIIRILFLFHAIERIKKWNVTEKHGRGNFVDAGRSFARSWKQAYRS